MKRVGKKKRADKAEPIRFTLKDHLQLWGTVGGIFAVAALGFHFSATHQQQVAFDELIAKWRVSYHLTDDQARRLRAMEADFHGNGNPFFRPAHTLEETRAHHRQMADVMATEDGERFFKAMEAGAEVRQR